MQFEEQQVRKRCQKTSNPCDSGRNHSKGPCPRSHSVNRVHHSQVAVDAHQANKEDPTVEGNVESAQDDFTHGIPKEPLVPSLVCLEGKGAHQEEICNCQVQEAHICHAPETGPENNHPADQRVSHKAQEEENRVEDREKGGSMFLIRTQHPRVPIEVVVVVIYCAELCEGLCEGLCDRTNGKNKIKKSLT